MANADLSLSPDLTEFQVPTAEGSDIASIDDTGVHLFTGGDYTTALNRRQSRRSVWNGHQWHSKNRTADTDGRVSQLALDRWRDGQYRLKYDQGEATATTDATGRYRFTTPASGPIIATGGTDTRTGLPFTQTFTVPAGSLSVTALSTLVQKMVQANGLTVGQATERVNLALGWPLNSNLTALNPVTATLNGAATAKALVADAVLTNVVALAQAGGATGDLYGRLAAVIYGGQLKTIDPTSVDTIRALGLSVSAATGIATLAQAGTPNEFPYTNVSTTTLGYSHGDSYVGPVAGLARQFI